RKSYAIQLEAMKISHLYLMLPYPAHPKNSSCVLSLVCLPNLLSWERSLPKVRMNDHGLVRLHWRSQLLRTPVGLQRDWPPLHCHDLVTVNHLLPVDRRWHPERINHLITPNFRHRCFLEPRLIQLEWRPKILFLLVPR